MNMCGIFNRDLNMNTFFKSAVALPLASAALSLTAFANEITVKLAGHLQIDYNIADADMAGTDWSASELRRARLGVSGQYGDNIKYKFELNTNSSEEVNIEDAWLQWTLGKSNWNIKIGQYKTPNSLDEQTSSRFISTLERAAFTDAFGFNRRLGVSVNTKGKRHTLSAGVFAENTSDISDKEGYALAARATFNPVKTDDTIVHVGGSIRYRDQGSTQGNIRYRQRPFTHIPGRVLSTGSIAKADTFLGVEGVAVINQFWVAGEFGTTSPNCPSCASTPNLNGAYVESGILIGGKKDYKDGKFNRPKVDNPLTDGGMGAVSFVVRFDTVDLADGSVNGGSYDNIILGTDWWPVKNVRLGINYFKVDADLGTSTSGLDSGFSALVAANVASETVNGVVGRLQFDF